MMIMMMMMKTWWLLVGLLAIASHAASVSKSPVRFEEDLFLRPLQAGFVSLSFVFTTKWVPTEEQYCKHHEMGYGHDTSKSKTLCHYGIFPRAIGQIVDRYQVEAAALRLTRGQWDIRRWGADRLAGGSGGPGGAEVRARFLHSTSPSGGNATDSFVEENAQWKVLLQALGGLMCSSLATIGPERTFRPRPQHFDGSGGDGGTGEGAPGARRGVRGSWWHGVLPREAVCSENLTPWTQLLPCRGEAGLAAILHPSRLFDTPYHELALELHADWDPLRLRPTRLRAEQRLTLVVPAPRPDRFSLRDLLAPPGEEEEEEERRGAGGKKRKGAAGGSRPFPASLGGCPLAATSAVRTAVPRWLLAESTLEFGHPPTNSVALVPAITSDWGHNAPSWQAQDIVGLVTHLLPTSGPRSAAAPLPLERGGAPWARWSSSAAAAAAAAEEEQGFLALGRRVSGASGLKAWLSTEVTNSAECDIGILYTDLMPHFIVPYFHTLTFQVFQNNSFSPFEPEQFTPKPASFPHLSILELNMTIPKHSTVIISMEVKKKLLDAFSFPPDASRGLDLHPGIAKVFGISNCEKSVDEGTTSSSNIAAGGGDSIVPLLKLIDIVEAEKLEESSNLISSAVRKYFGSRPPEVSLYSQSSLTYLPEPDFSMPFNVITINCTVIALFIGTMMNLLVRKSDVVAPNSKKKTGPRSKIRQVVDKIKSKFRFLQRKKNKKEHQS